MTVSGRHKPFDPEFLDQLEGRIMPAWEGSVWRAVVGTTNPMQPNQLGARWNAPNEEALYCSLTKECALAELESMLARQSVPVLKERKRYRLAVRLTRVLDLSDSDILREFTAEGADYFGEDHEVGQRMGTAAVFLDCSGMLVPSIRCSGTNLVIYVNRLNVRDKDRVDVIDDAN